MSGKNKNTDEQLRELFAVPPAEYRSVPFWAWNCRLDAEVLRMQIPIFREMGFGGFHIHVRTGMDTPYLGEEFFRLYDMCVEEAKKQGLSVWIYDEDRWASGAAGGMVTKEPAYRQKYLLFTPFSYEEKGPAKAGRGFLAQPERGCHGSLLARYDVLLDDEGRLKEYHMLKAGETAGHDLWYAYLETERGNPWYNGQTYSDTLKKEAVQRFLDITYEAYAEHFAQDFGKTIPAFFTDEPQFSRKHVLDFPWAKKDVTIPWTDGMENDFEQIYGHSLLEALPELFWEGSTSVTRYQYHDYVAHRFSESYFRTIHEWCEKHGVKFTGHLMEEPFLQSQCAAVGETMRGYRYMDIPGVDMLRRDMEFSTVKQAQSVSRQCGKKGVMSELYGVTGWDFDFRDYKFYGDWQAALGVTFRVPHLCWVSMEGEAKRDFPASIFYQSPWHLEFSFIEDYFARVAAVMSRGKSVVKVGVIHPIETCWLHWGPNFHTKSARDQMDEKLQNMINWLLFDTIDFDFICESTLPELASCDGPFLQVGQMQYPVILVPACETLRETTVSWLERFVENGGTLIFAGKCPELMDAKKSVRPKQLYEKSAQVPFEKQEILASLEKFRDVMLLNEDGSKAERMLYQLREEKDRKWLFLAPGKETYNKDISRKRRLQVRVRGNYKPVIWDAIEGTQKETACSYEKGWTVIFHEFYDYDSLLLSLENGVCEAAISEGTEKQQKPERISCLAIPKSVEVKPDEPNVLLLDKAEFALDDRKYASRTEILRLDNLCRERLGLDYRGMAIMQPWAVKKEKTEHTLWLRFFVESEIELDRVELALERPEEKEIYWNGVRVESPSIGWYGDHSIKRIALPGLKCGMNTLEVGQPFGNQTNTEWMYLLGDFSVMLKGENAVLRNMERRIGFGSITGQGFPFYSGMLTYKIPVDIPEKCALRVRVPHYRGAFVKVGLEGKNENMLVLPPYETDIQNVDCGPQVLNISVCIPRTNTFGPVHLADEKEEWFGPSAWRSEGDAWSENYCLRPEGILSEIQVKMYRKDI